MWQQWHIPPRHLPKAGYTSGAIGRHNIDSEVASMIDIGNILSKNNVDIYPFNRKKAPKFIIKLPIDFKRQHKVIKGLKED